MIYIYLFFVREPDGYQTIKVSINPSDYIATRVALLDGGFLTTEEWKNFIKTNEVAQRWLRQEKFDLRTELLKYCYQAYILRR